MQNGGRKNNPSFSSNEEAYARITLVRDVPPPPYMSNFATTKSDHKNNDDDDEPINGLMIF